MASTYRPYEVVVPHREDINAMSDKQRMECVRTLARLRMDPREGEKLKPLSEHQVHKRSLEDCWVVRVAAPYELEYRVVYQIDDLKRQVTVIAVGPRRGSAVYRLAMDRLIPPPEVPRWARFTRGRRQ
jgi:mRNA-degrading endonuclease RelE of RelBE toxin-antitoxin system